MSQKALIGMVRAAALAGAMFLAAGAIPFLGAIAMLLAPAPILLFAVGRSRPIERALGAIVLASLMVAIAAGAGTAASFLTTFGLAAGVIAVMLVRRQPFE